MAARRHADIPARFHGLDSEGAPEARLMLIGELPGDEEDLVGRCPVQLTALRGRPLRPGRAALIVSCHPAYGLRLPDPLRRAEARATLLEVLRSARELLDRGPRREDAPCGDGPGMPVAG